MDSIVSIAKGSDIKKTVIDSINLLGGIKNFVKKGEVVFIKPNLMAQFCSPYIVDVDVIKTVVEECIKAGAKTVYVGENPMSEIKGKEVLDFTGYSDILEKSGAKILKLDEEEYIKVNSGNAKYFKEFNLPKKFVESDVFIDLAKMKTHVIEGVTLCFKNYQGLLMHSEKRKMHNNSEGSLSNKFIDMVLFKKPNLCIIDAFHCLEGLGPMFGDLKKMNLIISSNDILSIDHCASKVMGFNPLKIPQIKTAVDYFGKPNYKILGKKINSVKQKFKTAHFDIPCSLGNLKFYSDIPDKGSEGILKLALSLFFSYSKIFEKEFSKLKGLSIVYGGLNHKIKDDTILLFGDTAIASKKFTEAKKYIEFKGNPPTEWFSVLRTLSKEFDLKIIGFMTSALGERK